MIEICSLTLPEASRAAFSWGGSSGSSSGWGLGLSLLCGPSLQSLHLSSHCLLLLALYFPLLSLLRTPENGFRDHHVIQDDLISRSLIASSKTLFLNKVPSTGSMDLDLDLNSGELGAPFNW